MEHIDTQNLYWADTSNYFVVDFGYIVERL